MFPFVLAVSCSKNCCNEEQKPVCGSDGKWYYNNCHFNKQKKCINSDETTLTRVKGESEKSKICGTSKFSACSEWTHVCKNACKCEALLNIIC